ncbi:MAG: hypothetical protein DRO67_06875 [Candidatus Asgardarchaeum californiense]|nr:MAG: hypothetical protein DRO67_06875 [Candidatus Asgardarchaeum californiense]
MRVNEIFLSIQGEGRYQGIPALFIRLSGCTRKCEWCDTKYHARSFSYTINDIVYKINSTKVSTVVWTGGEPLLQLVDIKKVILRTRGKHHHLETNGDYLMNFSQPDVFTEVFINKLFNYVAVSPKVKSVAERVYLIRLADPPLSATNIDIKVVTDLKEVGVDMLPYATMLMPLTTYNESKDKVIRRRVWKYCVQHNKFYSGRLHVEVWGKKRNV